MNEQTNLEVKIAKLETKLDFLIGEMKDLKDNFADRINKMEFGKLSAIDFTQFRNNEFAPIVKKVNDLWDLRWKIVAIAFAVAIIGEIVFRTIETKIIK